MGAVRRGAMAWMSGGRMEDGPLSNHPDTRNRPPPTAMNGESDQRATSPVSASRHSLR